MLKLGDYNLLPIIALDDKGGWLGAEPYGELFIPKRQLSAQSQVGDEVRVFLYLDADLAPVIATTPPKACAGQFACLKVVDSNRLGAFLDWGMKKDIFVPERNQAHPMEIGYDYVVYVYLDHEGRMVASSKVDSFLASPPADMRPGQAVELLIAEPTQLGFKAIVDGQYGGLLYRSDLSRSLPVGLTTSGYIKQVRPDNKIDLTLFKPGPGTVDEATQTVLAQLIQAGGFMPVNDKTDPDTLFRLFSISKGTFKKAIGGLYKQGRIVIDSDGIRTTEQNDQ